MANEIKLRLEVFDVYGKPIPEKIDIILRHQVLSEVVKANANAANGIEITGLRGAPQGLYRIEVDPPSYQYLSQFISMKASGTTKLSITFPIDPSKVKKVNFPGYSKLHRIWKTCWRGAIRSFPLKERKERYSMTLSMTFGGQVS